MAGSGRGLMNLAWPAGVVACTATRRTRILRCVKRMQIKHMQTRYILHSDQISDSTNVRKSLLQSSTSSMGMLWFARISFIFCSFATAGDFAACVFDVLRHMLGACSFGSCELITLFGTVLGSRSPWNFAVLALISMISLSWWAVCSGEVHDISLHEWCCR